ncbi:MAG: HepT-like ribonuclease domain-containing protein [Spirochaetota bacterium]
MFKRSDLAKLELILKYISDINIIVEKHGTIEKTLSDIEGEYAIMMCITQIGEAVNKIENTNILNELPSSKIIGLRNRIVHGYEDIDIKIISETIKLHIPELRKVVESLIGITK